MHPRASHLYKSRHGIWYFRWLVPKEFRERHPALPKELKRSTKTADTRIARAIARRLHCALLLRYAIGNNMSSPLDGLRYSGWTLKRDPATSSITELTVGPEDTPEMLARLDRVLDIEASRMQPAAVRPPAGAVTASAPSRVVLVGEAIDRYGKFQIQSDAWSENTFKHTHEPSLRLFKELVGRPMEVASESGATEPGIDLPLHEVTRQTLESFIEEFWSFPAQQGKRSEGKSARDTLRAGGAPQSRANVFKRLAHLRQFLAYCSDKSYVDADLLREIDLNRPGF